VIELFSRTKEKWCTTAGSGNSWRQGR